MDPTDPQPRYEHTVPEDTVLALHQLCRTCQDFVHRSLLLTKMSRGSEIKFSTSETTPLCSVDQLRAGYLGGCHFCALVWDRAGGHLLCSTKRSLASDDIIEMQLTARNWEIERRMWDEPRSLQFSGDDGVIVMDIPALRGNRRTGKESNKKMRGSGDVNLYIYPCNSPKLNPATLSMSSNSISSKHDLKLEHIRTWFHNCASNHNNCRRFSDLVAPQNQLPSRVLDIHGSRVKLECLVQDIPDFEYVTLSHMWGPDPTACLRLKQASLEEFKVRIPEDQLPGKYLDAIRVARALGFRYIWIDSLCIIQDSAEDWGREAVKMASVYGRTSCNISYVCPPSTDRGKHLRDPRIELPCKLRLPPKTSKSSHRHTDLVVQDSPGFIREYWSPTSHKEEWPILSRAWVFQERLLCPRNIYYGHSRLIWECCETFDDELYGEAKKNPEAKMRVHDLFAASDVGTRDFPGDFETQWTRLVKDYRTESLTYETDRAIAFAGIARAIQGQTKMTYLAGIWKEFAEFELLWIVRRPEALSHETNRKLAEQQKLAAPSWSWFSIATLPQESRLATDSVGFTICTSMAMESPYVSCSAQVVSWHHPHDTEALFHKFDGMKLVLRTRNVASKLEWVGKEIRLSSNGDHPFQDCGKLGPKHSMSYSHDDGSILPGAPLPTNSVMVLTIFTASRSGGKTIKEYQIPVTQEDDRDENVETQWNYAGLVVVPAAEGPGGEERWRRIGAFMYSNSADGKIQVPTPFRIDESQEEDTVLI
ncbi:hypothetical protein CDV36_011447 [Fusarium kuroshium]|uniref:Heterokaryon incompatibility domain-containing protein n=1 Tax=Fusarium kuroshium TaxID=2010991 RepID=A0A3M2RUD4_9HYPO|nr:hypothetical protein CDV36_011447 [Fusarium kuroshium]